MTFILHPTLAADTVSVLDGPLSKILLMNDCHYPWLILVPKRPNCVELTDLEETDYRILMREITAVSALMKQQTSAKKMNVATLGNMVPQLHIHIIARFANDPAWPRPVWGVVPVEPYSTEALDCAVQQWRTALAGLSATVGS